MRRSARKPTRRHPATRMPPSAGPMERARLTFTAASALACGICARGTSSWMAGHAGQISAAPHPSRKVKPSTTAGWPGPERSGGQHSARHNHAELYPDQQTPTVQDVREHPRVRPAAPSAEYSQSGPDRHRTGSRHDQPSGPDGLHPGAQVAADLRDSQPPI